MGFLYGKITVKIANEEMQWEILGDCLEKENQSIHYLLQLLGKTKSLKTEDKWLIGFLYIYIKNKNLNQGCQRRNTIGDIRWLFRLKKKKKRSEHTLSPSITK